MAVVKLKFQCIMCFSINEVESTLLGHEHQCQSCNKIFQLPNSSFAGGRVISDDFVIKRKLGSGAMGSVFLAHQLSMDREVALKVLFYQYTKDPKYAEEFNKEARAAARLNHINIIQSLAFGSDAGMLFTAMQYVEGSTFEKLIKLRGKMPLDDALNITQQVAEGLHVAWTEMQLIHRDIKPANIMITRDGIAKIADFGLARKANEISSKKVAGTPAYMSPEQFMGKTLDARSDIYSLGISLFEALAGELPFNGNNANDVAFKHLRQPIPIQNIKAKIPRKVKNLLRKMCAKDASDRFQDPEELLNRIVALRKQMAVDKAQVAGVHTMSIKRRNFNEPQRSKSLKTLAEYGQQSEEKDDEKKDKLKNIILYAGGVIILLLIAALAISRNDSKPKQLTGDRIISKVDPVKVDTKELQNLLTKFQLEQEQGLKKMAKSIDSAKKYKSAKITEEMKDLSKQMALITTIQKQDSRALRGLDLKIRKFTKEASTIVADIKDHGTSGIGPKPDEINKKEIANPQMALVQNLVFGLTAKDLHSSAVGTLMGLKYKASNKKMDSWLARKITEVNMAQLVNKTIDEYGENLIGERVTDGKIVTPYVGKRSFSVEMEDPFAISGNTVESVEWDEFTRTDHMTLLRFVWKGEESLDLCLAYYYLYNLKFDRALKLIEDKIPAMKEEFNKSISYYVKYNLQKIRAVKEFKLAGSKTIEKLVVKLTRQCGKNEIWAPYIKETLQEIDEQLLEKEKEEEAKEKALTPSLLTPEKGSSPNKSHQ